MNEVAKQEASGYVICGEQLYFCACLLGMGHQGPHEFDDRCGGIWEYDSQGKFVVHRFPIGIPF